MRSVDLAKRFREVVLDGKLIAFTNIREQLSDLTVHQATMAIEPLNTIAALTFHINYYISGVLQVFDGGELTIRDKFSYDMPAITTHQDWDTLRGSILHNAEKFAKHVELMSDAQLDSGFVKKEYGSYQNNIESMIEHCYYHFGQIVIIKKMIVNRSTS